MTIYLILGQAALLFGAVVWLGWEVRQARVVVGELREAVDGLRLKSRARVSTAGVRNTPVSDEAVLARLGRASRAKRVVVGGEEGSPLHTNLSRTISELEEVRQGDQSEN